jgi:oligopeptide transport system ATP-binding protein
MVIEMTEPLLKVEGLKKYFPIHKHFLWGQANFVKAVDGVTFQIECGETLGLVGESGCGKTTIGKTILRFEEPTAGKIIFEGTDLLRLSGEELRQVRWNLQMVFPRSVLISRSSVDGPHYPQRAIHYPS